MKNYGYYQSPIGWIEICANDQIINLAFIEEVNEKQLLPFNNVVINNCIEQLKQYFANQLQEFNLPLAMNGTPFQNLVWKEVYKIPYGTTITYQELANRINKPKAIRAVGTAVGKNPFAIIVPCHRVIRTNNDKIINYFWGKERKIFLQKLEKKELANC